MFAKKFVTIYFCINTLLLFCLMGCEQGKQPINTEEKSTVLTHQPLVDDNTTALLNVDIDWSSFLARHDLVWPNLTASPENDDTTKGIYHKGWNQGAFVGNGMIGTMIFKQDANTLRFQLGRNDVYARYHFANVDWQLPRLPIGDIFLSTVGKIKSEAMRLSLWDAQTTGTIVTDKGEVKWKYYAHASKMIMLLEVETSGEEQVTIETQPRHGISGRFEFTKVSDKYTQADKYADIALTPQPVLSDIDGVTVSSQAIIEQVDGAMQSTGEYAIAWQQKKIGNKTVYFHTITHSYPGFTASTEAAEIIKTVSQESLSALDQSHKTWWHNYYPQSFVSFSDAKWESFYWIQQYKIASATREGLPAIDNQGPWMTKSPWAGYWWNLNIQLSYSPTYIANRMNIAKSLNDMVFDNLDAFKQDVPDAALAAVKAKGMEKEDILTVGRNSSADFLTERKFLEYGNFTWVLHNIWRYYAHSMDHALAKEQLYPALRANMNLFLAIMQEDENGVINLPYSESPEYYQRIADETAPRGIRIERSTRNANYALSLMKWGMKMLLTLDKRYAFNDPLASTWRTTLSKLTDYMVDDTGLRIGQDMAYDHSHRHYSHLLSIFPLHLLNPEDTPKRIGLIKKSINSWLSKPELLEGYTYTGSSSMFATLGDGNEAYQQLTKGFTNFLQANTMYSEAGPVIETPISGAESIHYMLFQTWGGKLRFFPATPDNWTDASFNGLLAEGNFLVSGVRSKGKTQFIRIKSNSGEKCIVKHDISNTQQFGSRVFTITPVDNGFIEIDLKQGEEIILAANGVTDFTLSPVTTNAQHHNYFGAP